MPINISDRKTWWGNVGRGTARSFWWEVSHKISENLMVTLVVAGLDSWNALVSYAGPECRIATSTCLQVGSRAFWVVEDAAVSSCIVAEQSTNAPALNASSRPHVDADPTRVETWAPYFTQNSVFHKMEDTILMVISLSKLNRFSKYSHRLIL